MCREGRCAGRVEGRTIVPARGASLAGVTDHWTTPDRTPAPTPDATHDAPAAQDELVVLDGLEADLSAVEQAIASLEQISVDGVGGEAAANRIAAAVPLDRFGGTSPAQAVGAEGDPSAQTTPG